jgi:hypothetical protein
VTVLVSVPPELFDLFLLEVVESSDFFPDAFDLLVELTNDFIGLALVELEAFLENLDL